MAAQVAYQPTPSFDNARMDADSVQSKTKGDLREKLRVLVDDLQREADDRVSKKQQIENRWLEDLRQFHGVYPAKVLKDLTDAKRSTLFINETRPKTKTCKARLSDMMFPTDDRNWSIGPTPVPTLTKTAQQSADMARKKADQANAAMEQGQDPQPIVEEGNAHAQAAGQAKSVMDEAKARADSMQDEIDDQLRQCNYASEARACIDDACQIGTGIMKGPIAQDDRYRPSWQKSEEGWGLGTQAVAKPGFVKTSPWDLFPDPDALDPHQSEDWFERHLERPKGLRKLAKRPGFDADAIRRLLKTAPTRAMPTYIADLRQINGEAPAPNAQVYHVWEYRGILTAEKLMTICDCMGENPNAKNARELYGEKAEVDPLIEINVVLWFCEGEVIMFGLHPLDSGECIYSFYRPEKDPSSIWGFGIPYQMRDPQSALNGAWRAVMDNAGFASRPMLEIDTGVIEPADGNWDLYGGKVFLRKHTGTSVDAAPGIRVLNIESRLADLVPVIAQSEEFIDKVTNISTIAAGEQGAHVTDTFQGMAILMNAVNVIFREMVKNFDDDLTTPNIRRIYDWNMQFNEKDEIKGDYDVDARGSSVLLIREVQAQNYLAMIGLVNDPTFGPWLKPEGLLEGWSKSMMIPTDQVVRTKEEKDIEDKKRGEAMNPEVEKLKLQMALAEKEGQIKLDIANMQLKTEMVRMANERNMQIEDLRAMLEGKKMEIDHKERTTAAEIAVAKTMPPKSAQTVANPA